MTPATSSRPLALQIGILITAVTATVAMIIGIAVILQDRSRLHDALEDKGLLMAQTVASTAPEALRRHDSWALYKSLRQVTSRLPDGARDPEVITAMVLDARGRVMAHLDKSGSEVLDLPLNVAGDEERLLYESVRLRTPSILSSLEPNAGFFEAVVPVMASDDHLGVVRIRLSTADVGQKTWLSAATVLTLTFGLAALGSFAGFLMSMRLVVQPLRHLVNGMDSVGRGEQVALVADTNTAEIEHLVETFNRMANELAEKRRAERESAMNEKLIALGRVAAGVAHEVNNPLAGMLNCLSTLKAHPEQPDLVPRYLPMIEKGLERIRTIVQGLLVELRPARQQLDCGHACLEDVRDVILSEIGDDKITFDWDNRVGVSLGLDRTRVQQVMINLLKNGIQAMPNGGTLSLRAASDDATLRIEVRDTGVGISRENLDRLFDPFFTSRTTGTGLGLWVSYRLIQSMGGNIEVDSQPGLGSLFRVTLPLGAPAAERSSDHG